MTLLCQGLLGSFISTPCSNNCGFGFLMHTQLQDTLFTICQTVNPMTTVGLMCRLLSDSVSSLLLSLTPKLYPALYFIMVKLNQ